MTFTTSPRRSILLIAPFFLWGTAMVAMKGTVPHLTPLFLATVRLLPAGFLVLGAGLLMGRPQPQGWTAWLWIATFAGVDGTLFQGFLAEGLFRTGAGLGSVMIDSQPMVVALLAGWLFGEKLGLWGALGLAIGISGISLLGLPDQWILGAVQTVATPMVALLESTPLAELPIVAQGFSGLAQGLSGLGVYGGAAMAIGPGSPSTWLGNLFSNGQWLMLMAALSMAVGTILSRYVSRHCDPVMATGWHMVLGSVPLLLGSWVWETPNLSLLTALDYGALAYSTVFGTAIAYALF
ncbi:MAG: DMT family transporter, partial [Prochlorothrix sp.]